MESQAEQLLGPGDPELAQALQAVVQYGLTAWSDYWISRTVAWMVAEEVELFAELLREIASDEDPKPLRSLRSDY